MVCLKKKVKGGIKDISNLVQRVLRLDEEIQKYSDKFNEKERKIKRQLKVDLLKASIEFIESHESTLIPKSESQDDHKNGNELGTDTEEESPSNSL